MVKNNNQKGFSIIEVLIVLAIAGLIMLVVFLAVPALRRNAANNGRQSDASRISSAVQECLSNRQGKSYSCSTTGSGNVDVGDLSQLDPSATQLTYTGYTAGPGGVPAASPVTWTGVTDAAPLLPAVSADAINSRVVYASKCNSTGSGAIQSTNVRDFTVLYWKKGSGATNTSVCIGS